MPIEEAPSALAKVYSFSQGLLPVVAGNPCSVTKASDVTAVFEGYEQ